MPRNVPGQASAAAMAYQHCTRAIEILDAGGSEERLLDALRDAMDPIYFAIPIVERDHLVPPEPSTCMMRPCERHDGTCVWCGRK